jgi:protein MpaA
MRADPSSTDLDSAASPASSNSLFEQIVGPLIEASRQPEARLRHAPLAAFDHGERRYVLPRFVLHGDQSGGNEPTRIGIFAAIHGDEPEGALALRDFLLYLSREPSLAEGYSLYAYPVCNPTGLEDTTRHSRADRDLNREFWRGSPQPEVVQLERELGILQFHGVVALHSDDTAHGTYAYARGATLTEALAEPALLAAEKFLPRADGELIDGFAAQRGIICRDCYEGVLSNPAELHPAPFELIFETPQCAPQDLQVKATVAALQSILREYRALLAYGQDL